MGLNMLISTSAKAYNVLLVSLAYHYSGMPISFAGHAKQQVGLISQQHLLTCT